MSKDAHLKKATILGEIVELTYDDDTSLIVKKTDYDRVFQCMISCPKSEIQRDYKFKKTRRKLCTNDKKTYN